MLEADVMVALDVLAEGNTELERWAWAIVSELGMSVQARHSQIRRSNSGCGNRFGSRPISETQRFPWSSSGAAHFSYYWSRAWSGGDN